VSVREVVESIQWVGFLGLNALNPL